MDKNTVIGFILIFGILFVWNMSMKDDATTMLEKQRIQDSLAQVEQGIIPEKNGPEPTQATPAPTPPPVQDSASMAAFQQGLQMQYGAFAPAATGEEELVVLENNLVKITLSSKGGGVKEVLIKEYFKIERDSNHKEYKVPLKMMDDEKNRFEYLLPVGNLQVKSSQLFFQVKKEGANQVTFTADAGAGRSFQQVYSLKDNSYHVDYDLKFNGLENVINAPNGAIRLHWVDYLDKLELNDKYARNYATVYFKPGGDDYDYCSCTSDDEESLENKNVQWFAHSNQFFASLLMTKEQPFKGGTFSTHKLDEKAVNLKKLVSDVDVPFGGADKFSMAMYLGPKDFEVLQAYGQEVKYIVPFGSSIIGTANRWIIRPLFNFLSGFIGSKGIVILILTLIVKLVLYPLTYKMLHSQAKMAALKPQMAKLKEKYKDDQTASQMETMKLYREFGVNPLGGCFPIALQMPVWFALYRFFPASIEFRQESFLWATDLSSYDAAFWLPMELPFYGQHVSLFTLLWVITTLIYTYYNMQQMDMGNMGGANAKMMKYMQFAMPVFFLFFFNNFASGLTCYLVFSNIFNIAQTLITKNLIIDHDKIKQQLEEKRKKPKKKSGFSARIEEAMKQQQALAAQREAAKAARGKKKK